MIAIGAQTDFGVVTRYGGRRKIFQRKISLPLQETCGSFVTTVCSITSRVSERRFAGFNCFRPSDRLYKGTPAKNGESPLMNSLPASSRSILLAAALAWLALWITPSRAQSATGDQGTDEIRILELQGRVEISPAGAT